MGEFETETDSDSELLFWAVRYLTYELDRAEIESFERRLDRDQAAREALAAAVELSSALAAMPADAAPDYAWSIHRRRSGQAAAVAGLVSLAAAACLAALFWMPGQTAKRTEDSGREGNAAIAVQLPSRTVTLAWSSLQQERERERGEDGGELLALNDEPPPMPGLDLNSAEPGDAEASDHGLPGWLVEAASLARGPAPVKEL